MGDKIFSRKLRALDYRNADTFNLNNEGEVRNLIVFLEDNIIQRYTPDQRAPLKDIKNQAWVGTFKTYLAELKCPIENLSQKASVVNWLLGHAVHVKFSQDPDRYNTVHEKTTQTAAETSTLINTTRIDDPEVKVGIENLRKLLKIPAHPDPVLVLRAIAKLVETRLSEEAIAVAKQKQSSTRDEFLSLHDTALGFTTKDPALDEVAKILRLLQIHNLRDLQTQINSAIVTTQKLTANPKTDQSLGRVGRT